MVKLLHDLTMWIKEFDKLDKKVLDLFYIDGFGFHLASEVCG
jgi:hypothetical protein